MKDSYGFSVIAKTAAAKLKSYGDWLAYLGILDVQMNPSDFKALKTAKRIKNLR